MNALEKRFVAKLKAERNQFQRKAEGLTKVVFKKQEEVKQLNEAMRWLMNVGVDRQRADT